MRTKFYIKAASSSEVSDEMALAKLNLNFRKGSKPPIFLRNPGWASPTRTYLSIDTTHQRSNNRSRLLHILFFIHF